MIVTRMNQTTERVQGQEYRWAEGETRRRSKDWESKKQEFKWSERAQERITETKGMRI